MNLGVTAQKIDTICVETEIYRAVVSGSKQVPLLKERITILNDRIANYQIIIGNLNDKDSVTVAAYEQQIQLYKDEKKIYEDQLNGYEKLLRRQKRKTFFSAAGGVITTGIGLYLYLTK